MVLCTASGSKGANVRDVPAEVFVAELTKFLQDGQSQGAIKAPQWADLVKTGCMKEMPPLASNWWYARAASILRQVYLHPHTSVEALRVRYGGKHRGKVHTAHFTKASGKIIRTILQQLESKGLVEQDSENKAGRVVTSVGQRQMDQIAKSIVQRSIYV